MSVEDAAEADAPVTEEQVAPPSPPAPVEASEPVVAETAQVAASSELWADAAEDSEETDPPPLDAAAEAAPPAAPAPPPPRRATVLLPQACAAFRRLASADRSRAGCGRHICDAVSCAGAHPGAATGHRRVEHSGF